MGYYEHFFVPVDAISDLDPCELDILERLIVERRLKVYVEVGVGHLGTLSSVARTVKKHGLACRCIGIDAFGSLPRDERGENSHEGDVIRIDEARRHLASIGVDDVCTLHQGDSSSVLAEVMPSLVASSKVVFIDANHSYAGCLADYRAAGPWLADGDLLAFHDTITHQHPDYGRGPRGVVEDHVLDDPDFRLLALPPADAVLTEGESTLGLFDCVRPRAATFATAGFLVVRGLIDEAQVAGLMDDYQAMVDGRIAIDTVGGKPRRPDGLVQLAYPSRSVPAWREHAYQRRACAVASELLGEPMCWHEDQIIEKPPGYAGQTPWHQDAAYYVGEGVGYERAVACWLALAPAHAANGGLQYIPGSHRRDNVETHHDASDMSDVPEALEARVDAARAVAPCLRPGDAVFHHSRTLHFADGNATDTPRRAIVTHYWPVAEAS